MKQGKGEYPPWLYALGVIPSAWIGFLMAPSVSGGLPEIVKNFGIAIEHPFRITWCEDSVKTVLIFIGIYGLVLGIVLSSSGNYRSREEHGSAAWGNSTAVNKKYADALAENNKLLTQNVAIGLDGRKHMRNLNVLVVGGSGAGKTRFYAKPNVMQANTSFVVLDPNGYNLGG